MGKFRNSFVARLKYHSLLSEHEHMLIINIFDFYDEIINQMIHNLEAVEILCIASMQWLEIVVVIL